MIEYKRGDLLDVTTGLIAHGCNCQGVMGSGVALAIKKKYPMAFQVYAEECNSSKEECLNLLGKVQLVYFKDVTIANCFTQEFFGAGRQVSYDAIASCFRELDFHAKETGLDCINIPKIGAGLGGGDWEIISRIIESETSTNVVVWGL